jgi:hypothetical protein
MRFAQWRSFTANPSKPKAGLLGTVVAVTTPLVQEDELWGANFAARGLRSGRDELGMALG